MAKAATHVVDQYGKGGFTTLNAAIRAASSGDRILVRPGEYNETLYVDKQLEIIGDGPLANVEIWGAGDNVLTWAAVAGRVAGLTLRQRPEHVRHAVRIQHGRLLLEDCDISNDNASGVFIIRGADPVLRRNTIHDTVQHGVFCYEGGRGTLEDNQIIGCGYASVNVQEGSTPVLRRNTIRDGQAVGIRVLNTGQGLFEENVITGNASSGVLIEDYGYPTLRGNQITRNGEYGVKVAEHGAGIVEGNDLTGNRHGPWHVDKHAAANVVQARNTGS
ncbi:MAG TPA: right-handed parallel beta-helix repeat-containing protein [Trebonia sp.]|nr:right-handed parallel beta-helix repeat-containing protein [Trebonia sp.]